MKKIYLWLAACWLSLGLQAQTLQGVVYDADTKQPLEGVSIAFANQLLAVTNAQGQFTLKQRPEKLTITAMGYTPAERSSTEPLTISLQRVDNPLTEIVVSANRDVLKRTHAPVAISTINARLINETKATTIDQLVNKTPGVYMVNLGNEQHSMSIRQPMSTRATYLYLEDGIPIRTSGVFNHNALMEINMPAVRNIEVVKGPSSSLYGGEAIGGAINFLTQTGTAVPQLRVMLQGNDIGYRRADLQSGFTKGKWSGAVSGYYAQRRSGFIEYSDFEKAIITARLDYAFSKKLKLENSFTYMDYYSDMSGGVDSAMFADRSFKSMHTFTGRNLRVARYRSSLISDWNANSRSTLHVAYRFNELDMIPSFRIRDDYNPRTRRGDKRLAHGETSLNRFKSAVLIGQHRQKLSFWNTTILAGASLDFSPNQQRANYIRVTKDTIANKYVSYVNRPDSMLTDFENDILNYAGFINLEMNPIKNLRLVAAIRYDVFHYRFNNFLPPSAFSGSADTSTRFGAWGPKVGATYDFGKNRGVYANYSRGFVPPQVGELFRGVRVPNLQPAVYDNYEAGGWMGLWNNRITLDMSVYRLLARNAIISIRFDDGTFGNANAGGTKSEGIEMGMTLQAHRDLSLRTSLSYSVHRFTDYVENGTKLSNNEMPNAPRWLGNAEATYRPNWLPGMRMLLEWQHMGSYWMNAANTMRYDGFDAFNLRVGYQWKAAEIWVNVINLTDKYYAVNSSSSRFGTNYTVAEPRNINLGISYDFGRFFTKRK